MHSFYKKPSVHPGVTPTQPGSENYYTKELPALRTYEETLPILARQAEQVAQIKARYCKVTHIPASAIRDFSISGLKYRVLIDRNAEQGSPIGRVSLKKGGLIADEFSLLQLQNAEDFPL